MDFECLAGGCVFEFAVDIALLDEEGGIIELTQKTSVKVLLFEALLAHLRYCVHSCGKFELWKAFRYAVR